MTEELEGENDWSWDAFYMPHLTLGMTGATGDWAGGYAAETQEEEKTEANDPEVKEAQKAEQTAEALATEAWSEHQDGRSCDDPENAHREGQEADGLGPTICRNLPSDAKEFEDRRRGGPQHLGEEEAAGPCHSARSRPEALLLLSARLGTQVHRSLGTWCHQPQPLRRRTIRNQSWRRTSRPTSRMAR